MSDATTVIGLGGGYLLVRKGAGWEIHSSSSGNVPVDAGSLEWYGSSVLRIRDSNGLLWDFLMDYRAACAIAAGTGLAVAGLNPCADIDVGEPGQGVVSAGHNACGSSPVCGECWGTGFWRGFGAPCSRGCCG